MDTTLSLFGLQTRDIFIVTDDKVKAYRYFFETELGDLEIWEEIEEERCQDEGREYRPYDHHTEEEKNAIRERWYEDVYYQAMEVRRIPLGDIKGMKELTDPLKEKIVSLENQMRLNALKASVEHLPPLPVEIFDIVIASHLEDRPIP